MDEYKGNLLPDGSIEIKNAKNNLPVVYVRFFNEFEPRTLDDKYNGIHAMLDTMLGEETEESNAPETDEDYFKIDLDNEFLTRDWRSLDKFDLDDLLMSLNFVTLAIGAGCVYTIGKELKFRDFENGNNICFKSGTEALQTLMSRYNKNQVKRMWAESREICCTGRLSLLERDAIRELNKFEAS